MSSRASIKSEPISDAGTATRKRKPLGGITVVRRRLQCLGVANMKTLHRLLFDHDGTILSMFSNIEKFEGFSFPEGSADYNRKKATLNKLGIIKLNKLIFCFDLDKKFKRKNERVEEILQFLMSPRSTRPPRIFRCHNLGCGKTFPNAFASSRHKKTCPYPIVYFCDYCKKKFSGRMGLWRHKSNRCPRGIF